MTRATYKAQAKLINKYKIMLVNQSIGWKAVKSAKSIQIERDIFWFIMGAVFNAIIIKALFLFNIIGCQAN